jgi:hypothetical protein
MAAPTTKATAAAISNATDNGMPHCTSVGQKPIVTGSWFDSTKVTSTSRNSTAITNRIAPPGTFLGRINPTRVAAQGANHGALLRDAPDGLLRVWPVDRRVGSPRNNGPELLERIAA